MSYVDLSGLAPKPRWTPYQAVNYALGEVNAPDQWYGMLCDHFVTYCYGYAGSGYGSAITHYYNVPYRYRHSDMSTARPGAFVFWSIGSYGHVAIVVKRGRVASNDIKRYGKIDIVPISYISDHWGARLLGWTMPYMANAWGVNPHNPGPAVPPRISSPNVVSVQRVRPGKKNDDVRRVQRALAHEPGIRLDYSSNPGFFGPRTREAYTKWQHKCGYTGRDADGIPGKASLTRLGKRHKFKVVD